MKIGEVRFITIHFETVLGMYKGENEKGQDKWLILQGDYEGMFYLNCDYEEEIEADLSDFFKQVKND